MTEDNNLGEGMKEFLGELDEIMPNPQTPDAPDVATTAASPTATASCGASSLRKKSKTSSVRRQKMKPKSSTSSSNKATKNANTPQTPSGLTSLYDRTKVQMEERERKLKALQDQLMADYTFTPQSATSSVSSNNVSPSPSKVFERLYGTETAAMRARKVNRSPSASNSRYSTPTRNSHHRVQTTKEGYITPTRLLNLHEEGQNRLRSRRRTHKVRINIYCIYIYIHIHIL